VLAYALLTCLGVLLITLVFRPGPAGCLTQACPTDAPETADPGLVQQHYMFAGAGKFEHEAPEAIGSLKAQPKPAPFLTMIVAIWLGGVAVSLYGTYHRRRRALEIVRGAVPVGDPGLMSARDAVRARLEIARPVPLVRHADIASPAIAGTFRPVMFVPKGFEERSATEVEMVFVHELAHVRRRDPLATLLGELATSLFWFHPLVRRTARRMRDLQEIAADSHVVRSGVQPSRYAKYLLEVFDELKTARGARALNTHSILGDCLMDTRLRTILDPDTDHFTPRPTSSTAIALLFSIVCVALSLAPTSLQAIGALPQDQRPDVGESNPVLLEQVALDSIIRPLMIDRMADGYVAGAAVAVVHDGHIVYRGGFGDREVYEEVPVDPDRTIFRIGSITKVLTGVAVMQLVDRALLDLDADVNDYLTEFKIPDDFDEPVRVRHLLTHTAGFDQIGTGRHVRSREAVRPLGDFLAENLVRIRAPEEVSAYDTYAIVLAGYLVEQLSGMPYEEYLRREIFEPLRMHRSGITVPPALQRDVATGYEFRGEWFPQQWEYMNTDPASTVNATVTDMANFAIMLLNGGELDGNHILSEESVGAMLTQQYTNHPDQPGYGLTFWEDRNFGVPAFSHGGSMTGFGAYLYLVPDHDLGIYVAYNQESGNLAGALISRVIGALIPDREQPQLRGRLRPTPDLARFTGSYANNVYNHGDPSRGWRRRPFDLEIGEDGALIFEGAPAFAVGPLTFQRDDGLLLTFRENESGGITHLFVNQAVYEKLP
jgi:CubicO group peptidase (beta-lactamase class C family)